MRLETERLKLSAIELDDYKFYYKVQTQPKWIKFIRDPRYNSKLDAKNKLATEIHKMNTEFWHHVFKVELKSSQQPIGLTSIMKREWLDFPDLGYAFLESAEGKGYAYEAALATLNYFLDVMKESKILAVVDKANSSSIKLLSALNFKAENEVNLMTEDLRCYCYSKKVDSEYDHRF